VHVIIIAGTVDLAPEKRADALVAACPHMEATRAQKGCIDYVWSADPMVEGRIYVFERWESRDDLALHFEGPHYLGMLATMGAHEIRGVDVLKYKMALAEPVYGADGKATADFAGDA
jgi:quinol monooxygenase YgiN